MTKTIFITGTSSGLGKSAAKYFVTQGWRVAATMRTPENETELIQGENLKIYQMDVTDPDSVKQAVNNATGDMGRVDVVLNNAGIGKYGALEMISEQDIDLQWNTNVRGVINVIRTFLPHFKGNQQGMFINISSVMGLSTGLPLSSLYNMSKFALEGLIEGLYYELKPLNIDLRLVEPGGFDSKFSSQVKFDRDNEINGYEALTDKIEYVFNHIKDFQTGTVDEIVDVIYELAMRKNNNFRTIVGTDAQNFIKQRNNVSIESYLDMVASRFS